MKNSHNKGDMLTHPKHGKFIKPRGKTKAFRKHPQRSKRYSGHRG